MATSHPNNTSELEPHVSREGQAKVDFLLELSPFLPVTRKILSYLSPQDLCRSSCVTRDWNKLIENDKDAHFRKVKHIQAQLELLYAVGKVCVTHCHPHVHSYPVCDVSIT